MAFFAGKKCAQCGHGKMNHYCWCEKRALFSPTKAIILPRQARDKHRESTQKKRGMRFSSHRWNKHIANPIKHHGYSGPVRHSLKTHHSFLSFPYICPEPVLLNYACLVQNGATRRLFVFPDCSQLCLMFDRPEPAF
jgi:hypothetical protein